MNLLKRLLRVNALDTFLHAMVLFLTGMDDNIYPTGLRGVTMSLACVPLHPLPPSHTHTHTHTGRKPEIYSLEKSLSEESVR